MDNKKQRKRPGWISPIRINTKFRRKLVALFFAAILALVALTVRITVISATKGEEYKRIVLSNIQQQYESRVIPFKRGDITDRNGTLLAVSERVYNLVLDCSVVNHETEDDDGNKEMPYRDPTLKALELMFGVRRDEVLKILEAEETANSQYQIIRQNITMEQKAEWEAYCDLKNEQLTKEELTERSCINGIWFEESYKRVYPQNSLACDTIGFTYTLNDATWGIEGYYNDTLNGTNGRKFGYFNSDADVEQTIIEPTNGHNVVSTLDLNIQEIVRNAILDYEMVYSDPPYDNVGAKNVAVLVVDPNTGEIYAMDTSNWYDLNDPRDLNKILPAAQTRNLTEEEKIKKLNEIWRNFCVSDAYEPGSVAKPLTVAAALETSSIKDTDNFYCNGYEIVNGLEIHCSVYPKSHGRSNVYWTIANSCNDCMMQIARKAGAESLLRYLSYFDFGSLTGIDLPGENAGIIYSLESMGELELCTSSFGQGYTCTMVQEAAAIASIVNGGYYVKPHVVSAVTDENGNIIERFDPIVERQTISRKTSDIIKTAMGLSVTGGTSMDSKVNGYSMGGKTGTAEKLPRGTGDYLTSFIGFAPLDEPEVLVYVIVDEPNISEQDTSLLAQEIAHNVLSEVLPYLGVFPDEPVSTDGE